MSDLADEFEGEDVLNVYPDVPSTPIFPAVPSGPIMPVAPKTTSKEKEILAARRSEKFNSFSKVKFFVLERVRLEKNELYHLKELK